MTGETPRTQPSQEQLLGIIHAQREINRFGLDLNAVMSLVLDRAQHITDADSAAIELVNGEEIIYRAVSGNASHMLGLRLAVGSSLSGTCVTQGQLMRCDDSETDPRVDREACRSVGLRSMIIAPLMQHDQANGVIKVMSPVPGNFDAADEAVLEILSDIISLAMDNASRMDQDTLFRQATTDFLTGLYNRSFFIEKLRSTLELARREGRGFAVLMLDMDGLKAINDTLGHHAGDAAIKATAARISTAARRSDTAARIGGDEFAISLNGIDSIAAAEVFALRLMAACDEPVEFEGHTLKPGISIGLSLYPDDGNSVDRLLAVADARMYERKRQRRAARETTTT